MIGVVDYGGANHASVVNAVDNLGFDYFISDNKKSLDDELPKIVEYYKYRDWIW